MVKKAKKTKVVRVPLKQRIVLERAEAWTDGFDKGMREGMQKGRQEFLPPYDARAGLLDFARVVESWPINGDALVAIVATDLKYVCHAALPARVMHVMASEMKKRLA